MQKLKNYGAKQMTGKAQKNGTPTKGASFGGKTAKGGSGKTSVTKSMMGGKSRK